MTSVDYTHIVMGRRHFKGRPSYSAGVEPCCGVNLINSSPDPGLAIDEYLAGFDDQGAEIFQWYGTDGELTIESLNPPPGETTHLRYTAVPSPSFVDTSVSFCKPGSACFEFVGEPGTVTHEQHDLVVNKDPSNNSDAYVSIAMYVGGNVNEAQILVLQDTAADVKSKIEATPDIDEVTVTGSGTPGDPWIITFISPFWLDSGQPGGFNENGLLSGFGNWLGSVDSSVNDSNRLVDGSSTSGTLLEGSPCVLVNPGDTVTAEVVASSSGGFASGAVFTAIRIDMIDGSGNFISASSASSDFGDADGWVTVQEAAVVPAGGAYALPLVFAQAYDNIPGGIIDLGAFSIERTC